MKKLPVGKKAAAAAAILRKSGIVIMPAGTVYGLFCRALDPAAVRKIFGIKKRDVKKPLQVFLSSVDEIKKYAVITPGLMDRVKKYLPGPYTVILKLKPAYKKVFTFLSTGTIGIRVVNKGMAAEVVRVMREPVAATSANLSGKPAPKTFAEVEYEVLKHADYCADFDAEACGSPSSVVDLTGDEDVVVR